MPLVVISGYPASGKTRRALELKNFFEGKGKRVHHISENKAIPKAGFHKNEHFGDSQKEKIVRSDLKSESLRLLDKDSIVILDAGNYIKGYRYELYCATKAARSTQCTLFCGIQKNRAMEFNKQRSSEDTSKLDETDLSKMDNSNIAYSQDIFDGLCMRFEEPNGNCRWDCPLFVAFPDDTLEYDAIFGALFESKPLPPNRSTQNPPLSATNYLFELDRLTKEIVSNVLDARKIGCIGPVPIKNCDIKVQVPANVNAIQLNRVRREFLCYSKLHHVASSSIDNVPQLFVQFLNSHWSDVD